MYSFNQSEISKLEPEYSDDAEEFKDISILDVGHEMLEDEIGVETDGRNKIYHIDRGVEEITSIWTT